MMMTSTWRTVQTTLCEFLESSTIHGLVYISTSNTSLAKVLWICIIAFGFGTAGYLINEMKHLYEDPSQKMAFSVQP